MERFIDSGRFEPHALLSSNQLELRRSKLISTYGRLDLTLSKSSIQSLIRRFQNDDRHVLGTPMWNFGLPYKLKHLIDLVAQRNYLFAYDGK